MFNSYWYPHSPKSLAFLLRPREIGHWFLRLKCRESDGCRFSGPHRPHVWNAGPRLLTIGKAMEKPLEKKTIGKNFGKSFKNLWKRIAKALKTSGKLLVNPLETHWKVLEKPLEIHCKTIWKDGTSPWKTIGNPLKESWKTIGNTSHWPHPVENKALHHHICCIRLVHGASWPHPRNYYNTPIFIHTCCQFDSMLIPFGISVWVRPFLGSSNLKTLLRRGRLEGSISMLLIRMIVGKVSTLSFRHPYRFKLRKLRNNPLYWIYNTEFNGGWGIARKTESLWRCGELVSR